MKDNFERSKFMKKRIISAIIVLSLLIFAFAGCNSDKPTDEDDRQDQMGDEEGLITASIAFDGSGAVTLTAEESQAIRNIINSLEWTDMGEPCDCIPNGYFFIGETRYGFKYGEIEQGTKHAQDTSGVIQNIFFKYFPMLWDIPEGDLASPDEDDNTNETVKIEDSVYIESAIFPDEKDAKALRNALSSLEWIDTGDVCDCDPNFRIFIGEAIYHYHPPYHASHGSWVRGTKEAQDVDRTVEDIVKKYLPMYWD